MKCWISSQMRAKSSPVVSGNEILDEGVVVAGTLDVDTGGGVVVDGAVLAATVTTGAGAGSEVVDGLVIGALVVHAATTMTMPMSAICTERNSAPPLSWTGECIEWDRQLEGDPSLGWRSHDGRS